VLISLDEYNSLKETNYLLSGKNRDVLIQSIQQAEEGNVSEQELIEE
jgi:antitoxin YefM